MKLSRKIKPITVAIGAVLLASACATAAAAEDVAMSPAYENNFENNHDLEIYKNLSEQELLNHGFYPTIIMLADDVSVQGFFKEISIERWNGNTLSCTILIADDFFNEGCEDGLSINEATPGEYLFAYLQTPSRVNPVRVRGDIDTRFLQHQVDSAINLEETQGILSVSVDVELWTEHLDVPWQINGVEFSATLCERFIADNGHPACIFPDYNWIEPQIGFFNEVTGTIDFDLSAIEPGWIYDWGIRPAFHLLDVDEDVSILVDEWNNVIWVSGGTLFMPLGN